MRVWLAVAAAMPLFAASGASAQMKGLAPAEIASVARTRALDFRLSQELATANARPFMRGMIVQHGVAPNAVIGVGLANIYSRKRAGGELRIDQRPGHSRKPAVTFVMKF